MSDMQQLFKLANSLAKFAEDNEKVSLPLFSVKLTQAQKTYPEDYTIGMISTIVGKMANSDKLFISRAEIKDLYEKFHSRNNKFASVFGDELGQAEQVQPELKNIPSIVDDNMSDVMQQTLDNIVDPVLASALDKAFGGNSVKEYSASTIKQAVSICNNRFKDLGINVKSEVLCGKDDVLICAVAFETPRGTTSILVPVETAAGKVLYSPSVFIGNTGAHDISKSAIVDYVTLKAGDKLTIKAEEVLNAVLIAKNADQEVSDVDLAFIKMNTAKTASVSEYSAPQVLGIELDKVNPNMILDLPCISDPEIETIAETFDSDLGFANFKFGSAAIKQGHQYITQQLHSCGINNYNIAVTSSTNDAIMYAVSLNGGNASFNVPLKIHSNTVLPPTILLCNGTIKPFDKASLTTILRDKQFDRTAALSASPLYGVKPSELVNTVRTAVAEGNYAKAEDALNVLSVSDDDKAYSIALAAFTSGLKPQEEAAEEVSKCAMVIQNKNSQHDICGHTGLPLHKVCQDKHGNCQPLYRKGMADSYEGVNFMNHKVYL